MAMTEGPETVSCPDTGSSLSLPPEPGGPSRASGGEERAKRRRGLPSPTAINLWSTVTTGLHTEMSGMILNIVYLESSLAQVITVEMELNIYSQFQCCL